MSELSDYEARLTAALTRIRAGLDTPDESKRLREKLAQSQQQLDQERSSNTQLEERVTRLKERQDGRLADLESEVEKARQRVVNFEKTIQSLREANAELSHTAAQLRDAASENTTSPELINTAMKAELEAIRAAQNANVTELNAILDALEPILKEEAQDAAS